MKRVQNVILLLCFIYPFSALGQHRVRQIDINDGDEEYLASSLDLDNVIVSLGYIPTWTRGYSRYLETNDVRNLTVYMAGQGSVISWNRKSFILTCAHIVEAAKVRGQYDRFEDVIFAVKNRRYDPRYFIAHLVYMDENNRDIALLQVDDASFYDGIFPLEISEQGIDLGDKVYSVVISSRRAYFKHPISDLDIRKGVAGKSKTTSSKLYDYLESTKVYNNIVTMVNWPCMPGDSGSVALSSEGKVVGILIQGRPDYANYPNYTGSIGINVSALINFGSDGVRSGTSRITSFSELRGFFENYNKLTGIPFYGHKTAPAAERSQGTTNLP